MHVSFCLMCYLAITENFRRTTFKALNKTAIHTVSLLVSMLLSETSWQESLFAISSAHLKVHGTRILTVTRQKGKFNICDISFLIMRVLFSAYPTCWVFILGNDGISFLLRSFSSLSSYIWSMWDKIWLIHFKFFFTVFGVHQEKMVGHF